MSNPQVGVLRRWRVPIALALAVAAAVTIALVTSLSGSGRHSLDHLAAPLPHGGGGTPDRPNIVFVLTDDLSWNLVQYMPHVLALEHAGMTFTNYTVTDSLCCPSRASIFTGDFPHNTHVFGNAAPTGGAAKFYREGDDKSTFATDLTAAGYRTSLIGKYLNQYNPSGSLGDTPFRSDGAYVPPGWTSWNAVDDHGYGEYDYTMANNHATQHYGHAASDYLTSVAQDRGEQFIVDSARKRKPFLLEVASFAPHTPYTPAPRDIGTFTGVRAPRTPAFNRLPKNPPRWLAYHGPLTKVEIAMIDRRFERRVEAVQSVDRMIGAFEATLQAMDQLKDTVFVFSSDNGYHMGEYQLHAGKQTAFDTDVRVPLIVAGPNIPADTTNDAITENIDLRPTFDQLSGAPILPDVDGRSLIPLFHGEEVPWRTVAGIEHHRPALTPDDPDEQNPDQGYPPTYNAIRTASYTYVRYVDGEREYYDRRRDPFELDNVAAELSGARLAALNRRVDALTTCRGQVSCWAAGRPRLTHTLARNRGKLPA